MSPPNRDDPYYPNLPTYSRDQTVRAVTSFYEFLIELYLPESCLKQPPPGGWPDLTSEYLSWLEKTPTVVDLIRHLPYIASEDDSDPHQIYEKTRCNDYTSAKLPALFEPIESWTTIPSHVLTLASIVRGRDGYFIFLDTKRGTAVLMEYQDGPGSSINDVPYPQFSLVGLAAFRETQHPFEAMQPPYIIESCP